MKGYWLIIGTEITDEVAQKDYGEVWKPIAAKYGARVNQLATPPLLLEARDARRVIVVEFPSYEIARACYDDREYQEARLLALKASKRELLIIQGDLI